MSPMVKGSKENYKKKELVAKNFQNEKKKLIQLRRYIEKNFDYVGKDFSKKVREIYYDKKIIKQFMEQLLLKKEKN